MHSPEDDPDELSSPACLISEASDAYMGYADAAELIVLLRQVLESRAADRSVPATGPENQGETIRALKAYLHLLGVPEATSEGWLRTQAAAIEHHPDAEGFAAQIRRRAADAIAAALPRVRNQRLHDELAAILRQTLAARFDQGLDPERAAQT